MGSEKYPSENDFGTFISQHGGTTNASTDYETVCTTFLVCVVHCKNGWYALYMNDNNDLIIDSYHYNYAINFFCRLCFISVLTEKLSKKHLTGSEKYPSRND